MTTAEIDNEVRKLYASLTSKIPNYNPGNLRPENAEVVNKCLELYFQLKEENKPRQLELFE